MDKHGGQNGEHNHGHSITEELICHFPYAVLSVAFGLILISFLEYFALASGHHGIDHHGAHVLFHAFHFMHIAFAATGTLITFYRFSKNHFLGILVGLLTPFVFCSLSDIVLPYLGGRVLGVPMNFHFCFVSEYFNVIPFLIVGLLNGFILSRHHSSMQGSYSRFSHFFHILLSSLASVLYLVSNGFDHWHHKIGALFLLLIVAVVAPCTLSDVVVPMIFARKKKG